MKQAQASVGVAVMSSAAENEAGKCGSMDFQASCYHLQKLHKFRNLPHKRLYHFSLKADVLLFQECLCILAVSH